MPVNRQVSVKARMAQQYKPGVGQHFTTPKKSRRGPRYKEEVKTLAQDKKLLKMEAELKLALGMFDDDAVPASGELTLNGDVGAEVQPLPSTMEVGPHDLDTAGEDAEGAWIDEPMNIPDIGHVHTQPPHQEVEDVVHHHDIQQWVNQQSRYKRGTRDKPTPTAENLYNRWRQLLPQLVNPLLEYESRVIGIPAQTEREIDWSPSQCRNIPYCQPLTYVVMCLFWDHFSYIEVPTCRCRALPLQLVSKGFFPTSPTEPRVAISIDLLNFYSKLLHHSGDAVSSLAAALNSFYHDRGWMMINKKGNIVRDPFRRGLGNAVQWYDNLQTQVTRSTDIYLQECNQLVEAHKHRQKTEDVNSGTGTAAQPFERIECARILQTRCPACFGGNVFGRPNTTEQGGDVHVCLDGNFHQRHRKAAGDCPWFYEPRYFIPKTEVDSVGQHIDSVRKRPAREKRREGISDQIVDSCLKSHEAADGTREKTNADVFDDTGLMALTCRHDIPIFYANIDTPGEQQKYAVALLKHLFEHLPNNATVSALYDVGCVLERSLDLYDILPDNILLRLRLVTPAMHAYAHEWECQLQYGTRLQTGMGLTDGEGNERLWARNRSLIPITRSSARSRRIWLLDRKAADINRDLKNDLGAWLVRKLKNGVEKQLAEAREDLADSGYSEPFLKSEWDDQRRRQKSKRHHAPTKIKKNLAAVIDLQHSIENITNIIQATRRSFNPRASSAKTSNILTDLEVQQKALFSKCDELYQALNLSIDIPNYDGVSMEFMQYLLCARDVKITVRTMAVASFFEWEKLDQAAGGRHRPLGTKVHQRLRKAIIRRRPQLLSAIKKFNSYCEKLESLKQPNWNVIIPTRLTTDLSILKNDSELLQDVWISPDDDIPQVPPAWMTDPLARKGIKGVLKVERCHEERRRIGKEADNLCRWFGKELCAIEVAVRFGRNSLYEHRLKSIRQDHMLYVSRWSTPLVNQIRYESQISSAREVAEHIFTGTVAERPLHWLPPLLANPTPVDFGNPTCLLQFDPDILFDVEVDSALGEHPIKFDEHSEEHPDASSICVDSISDINEDFLEALNLDEPVKDEEEITLVGTVATLWELQRDQSLADNVADILQEAANLTMVFPNVRSACRHASSDGRISFEKDDVARIAPGQLLNAGCISESLKLMRKMHDIHGRFAIFNTYALEVVKSHDDIFGKEYIKRLSYSGFLNRSEWIIPIHCDFHWTMMVVNCAKRELWHFDSLARKSEWEKDVTRVFEFVKELLRLTGMSSAGIWTAKPMLASNIPLQSNGIDCGVWIIAAAMACMRGYRVLSMKEVDIPTFRRYLLKVTQNLSIA